MTSDKAYDVERRLNNLVASLGNVRIMTTGTTTINSTSPTTLGSPTAFSVPVLAASYHWRAHLMYVGNGLGSTNGTPAFRVTCPSFTNGSYQLVGTANGPLVSVRFDNTSGGGVDLNAPTLVVGDTATRFDVTIEGAAQFTSSSSLAITARITASTSAQYVIAVGSTFDVWAGY